MCVGIPMRVLTAAEGMAECEGRGRRERVNAMLLDDLAPGAHVLVYQGSAIRVLSEDEAEQTNRALDALDAALHGQPDIDLFFFDLVNREPQLPPHLKDRKQ